MSLLQTTGINVLYELANLARGQVTARITPKTWWANMQQGMVWDLDDFTVNQIGHPYQGNNYFNAGRANGLTFYESAAVTAFGSATWEFFGETNHASLNDFINTTLGGITLGEMFHRAGWMIRDTQATGKRRLWSEIGATALDPVTGANRFASGDSSRVTAKPSEFVPSTLSGVAAAESSGADRSRALLPRRVIRSSRWTPIMATPTSDAAAHRTMRSGCGCASAAAARSAKRACEAGCSDSRSARARFSSP